MSVSLSLSIHIYIYIYIYICLSVCLSIYLYMCLSLHLSVCLYNCIFYLSIYLSIAGLSDRPQLPVDRLGDGRRTTPSPPTKSFPTKSPRVELSGRLPIRFNGHENSHPLELRVCLSQTL